MPVFQSTLYYVCNTCKYYLESWLLIGICISKQTEVNRRSPTTIFPPFKTASIVHVSVEVLHRRAAGGHGHHALRAVVHEARLGRLSGRQPQPGSEHRSPGVRQLGRRTCGRESVFGVYIETAARWLHCMVKILYYLMCIPFARVFMDPRSIIILMALCILNFDLQKVRLL